MARSDDEDSELIPLAEADSHVACSEAERGPARSDGDANEAEGVGVALEGAKAEPGERLVRCKGCGAPMRADSSVCSRCGQDQGKPVPARVRAKQEVNKPTCGKCGYDLTGCRGDRCPECGTVLTRAALRRATQRQEIQRAEMMRLIPAGVLIALSLMIGTAMFATSTTLEPAFSLPLWVVYPLMLGVAAAGACVLTVLATYVLVSCDQRLHVMCAGVAASVAVCAGTWVVVAWVIPLPLVPWLAAGAVTGPAVKWLLDIELEEMAILSILYAFIVFLSGMVLLL